MKWHKREKNIPLGQVVSCLTPQQLGCALSEMGDKSRRTLRPACTSSGGRMLLFTDLAAMHGGGDANHNDRSEPLIISSPVLFL